MKPVIDQLKSFFSSQHDRIWLEDQYMKVYVRKTKRFNPTNNEAQACLDLASFEVKFEHRRQGHTTQFINEAHSVNPFRLTYIENVGSKRFIGHLILMGFDIYRRPSIGGLLPHTLGVSLFKMRK